MPDQCCPTCLALLAEADRLAFRARQLDREVERARTVGKGCATPASAILNNYDSDLNRWQSHVGQHLKQHRDASGTSLATPDLKGPPQ